MSSNGRTFGDIAFENRKLVTKIINKELKSLGKENNRHNKKRRIAYIQSLCKIAKSL